MFVLTCSCFMVIALLNESNCACRRRVTSPYFTEVFTGASPRPQLLTQPKIIHLLISTCSACLLQQLKSVLILPFHQCQKSLRLCITYYLNRNNSIFYTYLLFSLLISTRRAKSTLRSHQNKRLAPRWIVIRYYTFPARVRGQSVSQQLCTSRRAAAGVAAIEHC